MSNSNLTNDIGFPVVQGNTRENNYQNKNQSYEIVSEIKWYYYLIPKPDRLSLIGDLGDVSKKFVVCAHLPKQKYSNGYSNDYPQKSKVIRLFAAFDSYLDFLRYARKIPVERWYFFEVILGNQKQKLYFDIDIHSSEIKSDINSFTHQLLSQLIGRIIEVFRARNIELKIDQEILLFSSNSIDGSEEEKKSYHIIINKYAVLNYRENALLAGEILEGFPEEYLKFIDVSMYSSKQQFRLYKSRKPDSNRVKNFVDIWQYGNSLVQYKYPDIRAPDQESLEAIKFTTLFGSSCVTVTDECQVLQPMIVPEDNSPTGKMGFQPHNFDDDQLTPEIITEIIRRSPPALFQIYEINKVLGTLIILQRKTPAFCNLCQRIHESENAFLRVNSKGQTYFYCRRVQNVSKFVVDVSDLMDCNVNIRNQHLESLTSKLSQSGEFFQNNEKTIPNQINTGQINFPRNDPHQKIPQKKTVQFPNRKITNLHLKVFNESNEPNKPNKSSDPILNKEPLKNSTPVSQIKSSIEPRNNNMNNTQSFQLDFTLPRIKKSVHTQMKEWASQPNSFQKRRLKRSNFRT